MRIKFPIKKFETRKEFLKYGKNLIFYNKSETIEALLREKGVRILFTKEEFHYNHYRSFKILQIQCLYKLKDGGLILFFVGRYLKNGIIMNKTPKYLIKEFNQVVTQFKTFLNLT